MIAKPWLNFWHMQKRKIISHSGLTLSLNPGGGILQNKREPEHLIQSKIRLALAPHALMFRTNAGEFWQGRRVYSKEFEQPVLIDLKKVEGLPKGFSDLCGCRRSDGRFIAIECKTPNGRVRPEQEQFIAAMREARALAGIARSEEDAIKILTGETI